MANGNNRKSEAPWFREIGAGSQPLKSAVETVLAAAGSQSIDALVAKVRAALQKDGVNIPDPHLKGLVTNALAFHKALKGTGALGGGGSGGVRP
jgi:hypothetical protein